MPNTIVPKIIKYLGINVTKNLQDLYTKNYKALLREILKDLNRLRDRPFSWIRRHNIVAVLPNFVYIINVISVKT